jgi:octaprenyl-diphosphate synthase
VLLGDYLFATAFSLSASLDNPLASRYLSWVAGVVCQGEIAQIAETGNLDLDEETYFDVIEKKTAYLFAGAARVGAEYQDASEAEVAALSDYGMKLGTAFQIVDDILDVTGDEEQVGKTLGTDAGQGKVTLPVLHYLRAASTQDAARVRSLLGKGGRDGARKELRGILEESGSLGFARRRAEWFADESCRVLGIVRDSLYRQTLIDLARYALSRRR